MILYFITEARFIRKGSKVYCTESSMTNLLWDRYLCVFEKIRVIARVLSDSNTLHKEENLASSDKVSFIDLPYYIGPKAFLKKYMQIRNIMRREIAPGYAYIARVPGILGTMACGILKSRKISYAVEVVGDPWDVFAPGNFHHVFRPLLRINSFLRLRFCVKNANSVLYVTKKTLQKRYPASSSAFTVNISDVAISKDNSPKNPRVIEVGKNEFKLISVGSLAQMYKSPDIVLRAMKILVTKGYKIYLTWLGDGVFKDEMTDYAKKIGISSFVSFVGNVSASKVIEYLKDSDIFVLASKTEGLPRALIEAMSMGLPCIGTKVGGIPELLGNEVLVPAKNEFALATKIEQLITDVTFANGQARINFRKSKEYYDTNLQVRRVLFYKKIIERSTV